LKDPAAFAQRFYRLLNGALGIAKDAPIEEYEVDIEDEEDEATTTTDEQVTIESLNEDDEGLPREELWEEEEE